jgi:hypothetical protein
MNKLNVNASGVNELNGSELMEINGGGKWRSGEAGVAYLLSGVAGVGFYALGTMPD